MVSPKVTDGDFTHFRCPTCLFNMWTSCEASYATCDGGGRHKQVRMLVVKDDEDTRGNDA